jgi:hypothetical protein
VVPDHKQIGLCGRVAQIWRQFVPDTHLKNYVFQTPMHAGVSIVHLVLNKFDSYDVNKKLSLNINKSIKQLNQQPLETQLE